MHHSFLRYVCMLMPVLAIGFAGHAQTDVLLSQAYAMPTYYNPGYAGSTDMLRLRAAGRLQWVGIDHAPRSFIGTADMPLSLFGKKFGVGAVVSQESYGLYSTLQLGAQAGFKFKKFGGTWSVGVQLGMYDQGFKGSEVILPDDDDFHEGNDDGLPTTDVHGTAFDMAAGISYTHKYFTAGIGCMHLMSPTVTLRTSSGSGSGSAGAHSRESTGLENEYVYEAKRTLYFQAQGNIPVKNTLFDILPSVIVASDLTNTSAGILARARYRQFLRFGAGYR
ncbi:MAG: PorP/SprF family type IX secretion system membrane protein, partial [Muribaculaceae bacterium]|nr:PorP/SprF family type IX secretion system membrane protein [Muribaculaceae bacterium]